MARKQSAHIRRPSRQQVRHQPYNRSLPIRNGSLYPGTPIEPQPEWDEAAEVRNELRQAVARLPQTPYSDGPPTPSSTLSSDSISRTISPCLTNASLAVEYPHSLSPLGAPTPGSEDSSGFVYLTQNYQSVATYDFAQPLQPYASWSHQTADSREYSASRSRCSHTNLISHTSGEHELFSGWHRPEPRDRGVSSKQVRVHKPQRSPTHPTAAVPTPYGALVGLSPPTR